MKLCLTRQFSSPILNIESSIQPPKFSISLSLQDSFIVNINPSNIRILQNIIYGITNGIKGNENQKQKEEIQQEFEEIDKYNKNIQENNSTLLQTLPQQSLRLQSIFLAISVDFPSFIVRIMDEKRIKVKRDKEINQKKKDKLIIEINSTIENEKNSLFIHHQLNFQNINLANIQFQQLQIKFLQFKDNEYILNIEAEQYIIEDMRRIQNNRKIEEQQQEKKNGQEKIEMKEKFEFQQNRFNPHNYILCSETVNNTKHNKERKNNQQQNIHNVSPSPSSASPSLSPFPLLQTYQPTISFSLSSDLAKNKTINVHLVNSRLIGDIIFINEVLDYYYAFEKIMFKFQEIKDNSKFINVNEIQDERDNQLMKEEIEQQNEQDINLKDLTVQQKNEYQEYIELVKIELNYINEWKQEQQLINYRKQFDENSEIQMKNEEEDEDEDENNVQSQQLKNNELQQHFDDEQGKERIEEDWDSLSEIQTYSSHQYIADNDISLPIFNNTQSSQQQEQQILQQEFPQKYSSLFIFIQLINFNILIPERSFENENYQLCEKMRKKKMKSKNLINNKNKQDKQNSDNKYQQRIQDEQAHNDDDSYSPSSSSLSTSDLSSIHSQSFIHMQCNGQMLQYIGPPNTCSKLRQLLFNKHEIFYKRLNEVMKEIDEEYFRQENTSQLENQEETQLQQDNYNSNKSKWWWISHSHSFPNQIQPLSSSYSQSLTQPQSQLFSQQSQSSSTTQPQFTFIQLPIVPPSIIHEYYLQGRLDNVNIRLIDKQILIDDKKENRNKKFQKRIIKTKGNSQIDQSQRLSQPSEQSTNNTTSNEASQQIDHQTDYIPFDLLDLYTTQNYSLNTSSFSQSNLILDNASLSLIYIILTHSTQISRQIEQYLSDQYLNSTQRSQSSNISTPTPTPQFYYPSQSSFPLNPSIHSHSPPSFQQITQYQSPSFNSVPINYPHSNPLSPSPSLNSLFQSPSVYDLNINTNSKNKNNINNQFNVPLHLIQINSNNNDINKIINIKLGINQYFRLMEIINKFVDACSLFSVDHNEIEEFDNIDEQERNKQKLNTLKIAKRNFTLQQLNDKNILIKKQERKKQNMTEDEQQLENEITNVNQLNQQELQQEEILQNEIQIDLDSLSYQQLFQQLSQQSPLVKEQLNEKQQDLKKRIEFRKQMRKIKEEQEKKEIEKQKKIQQEKKNQLEKQKKEKQMNEKKYKKERDKNKQIEKKIKKNGQFKIKPKFHQVQNIFPLRTRIDGHKPIFKQSILQQDLYIQYFIKKRDYSADYIGESEEQQIMEWRLVKQRSYNEQVQVKQNELEKKQQNASVQQINEDEDLNDFQFNPDGDEQIKNQQIIRKQRMKDIINNVYEQALNYNPISFMSIQIQFPLVYAMVFNDINNYNNKLPIQSNLYQSSQFMQQQQQKPFSQLQITNLSMQLNIENESRKLKNEGIQMWEEWEDMILNNEIDLNDNQLQNKDQQQIQNPHQLQYSIPSSSSSSFYSQQNIIFRPYRYQHQPPLPQLANKKHGFVQLKIDMKLFSQQNNIQQSFIENFEFLLRFLPSISPSLSFGIQINNIDINLTSQFIQTIMNILNDLKKRNEINQQKETNQKISQRNINENTLKKMESRKQINDEDEQMKQTDIKDDDLEQIEIIDGIVRQKNPSSNSNSQSYHNFNQSQYIIMNKLGIDIQIIHPITNQMKLKLKNRMKNKENQNNNINENDPLKYNIPYEQQTIIEENHSYSFDFDQNEFQQYLQREINNDKKEKERLKLKMKKRRKIRRIENDGNVVKHEKMSRRNHEQQQINTNNDLEQKVEAKELHVPEEQLIAKENQNNFEKEKLNENQNKNDELKSNPIIKQRMQKRRIIQSSQNNNESSIHQNKDKEQEKEQLTEKEKEEQNKKELEQENLKMLKLSQYYINLINKDNQQEDKENNLIQKIDKAANQARFFVDEVNNKNCYNIENNKYNKNEKIIHQRKEKNSSILNSHSDNQLPNLPIIIQIKGYKYILPPFDIEQPFITTVILRPQNDYMKQGKFRRMNQISNQIKVRFENYIENGQYVLLISSCLQILNKTTIPMILYLKNKQLQEKELPLEKEQEQHNEQNEDNKEDHIEYKLDPGDAYFIPINYASSLIPINHQLHSFLFPFQQFGFGSFHKQQHVSLNQQQISVKPLHGSFSEGISEYKNWSQMLIYSNYNDNQQQQSQLQSQQPRSNKFIPGYHQFLHSYYNNDEENDDEENNEESKDQKENEKEEQATKIIEAENLQLNKQNQQDLQPQKQIRHFKSPFHKVQQQHFIQLKYKQQQQQELNRQISAQSTQQLQQFHTSPLHPSQQLQSSSLQSSSSKQKQVSQITMSFSLSIRNIPSDDVKRYINIEKEYQKETLTEKEKDTNFNDEYDKNNEFNILQSTVGLPSISSQQQQSSFSLITQSQQFLSPFDQFDYEISEIKDKNMNRIIFLNQMSTNIGLKNIIDQQIYQQEIQQLQQSSSQASLSTSSSSSNLQQSQSQSSSSIQQSDILQIVISPPIIIQNSFPKQIIISFGEGESSVQREKREKQIKYQKENEQKIENNEKETQQIEVQTQNKSSQQIPLPLFLHKKSIQSLKPNSQSPLSMKPSQSSKSSSLQSSSLQSSNLQSSSLASSQSLTFFTPPQINHTQPKKEFLIFPGRFIHLYHLSLDTIVTYKITFPNTINENNNQQQILKKSIEQNNQIQYYPSLASFNINNCKWSQINNLYSVGHQGIYREYSQFQDSEQQQQFDIKEHKSIQLVEKAQNSFLLKHSIFSSGIRKLNIFSSIWIINETGLPLIIVQRKNMNMNNIQKNQQVVQQIRYFNLKDFQFIKSKIEQNIEKIENEVEEKEKLKDEQNKIKDNEKENKIKQLQTKEQSQLQQFVTLPYLLPQKINISNIQFYPYSYYNEQITDYDKDSKANINKDGKVNDYEQENNNNTSFAIHLIDSQKSTCELDEYIQSKVSNEQKLFQQQDQQQQIQQQYFNNVSQPSLYFNLSQPGLNEPFTLIEIQQNYKEEEQVVLYEKRQKEKEIEKQKQLSQNQTRKRRRRGIMNNNIEVKEEKIEKEEDQQDQQIDQQDKNDIYQSNIHPYNRIFPVHELILSSELAQYPFEQTIKVNISHFYTIQSRFKQKDIWVRQYIEGSEWYRYKENDNLNMNQLQLDQQKFNIKQQIKESLRNKAQRQTYHLLRASGLPTPLNWYFRVVDQYSYTNKLIQFAFDNNQLDINQLQIDNSSQSSIKSSSEDFLYERLSQLQWSGPVSVQQLGEQYLLVPQKQRKEYPHNLLIKTVYNKTTKGNFVILIPESEKQSQKYVINNHTVHEIQIRQVIKQSMQELQSPLYQNAPYIKIPAFNRACVSWFDCVQQKDIEIKFGMTQVTRIYQFDQIKRYDQIELHLIGSDQIQQSSQQLQQINPPHLKYYTEIIHSKVVGYGDQFILDLSYNPENNMRIQQMKINQIRIAQQRKKMKKEKQKKDEVKSQDNKENIQEINNNENNIQIMKQQSGININVNIRKIGISVITQGSLDLQSSIKPQEILFLSIDKTSLLYQDTNSSMQFNSQIKQIQIDNQNPNAIFPVIFGRGIKQGDKVIIKKNEKEPMINITYITSKQLQENLFLMENNMELNNNEIEIRRVKSQQKQGQKKNVVHIVLISAVIQPMNLSVDEDLIFTILQFYSKEIKPIFNSMKTQKSNNQNIIGDINLDNNQIQIINTNGQYGNTQKQINKEESSKVISASFDDIIPSLRMVKTQKISSYRLNLIEQQNNKQDSIEKQMIQVRNTNSSDIEYEQQQRIFAEIVFIGKTKIGISLSINDLSNFKSFGLLTPVLNSFASLLLKVNSGAIKLQQLLQNNVSGMSNDIMDNVITHYKSQLKDQLLSLLGSMEAIGNPAKFASRFASDLQNIIGPESNRNIPPKQIVKGIAKFGGKIVPNALLGVIGSIGSMAGAISSSLTQLTQNDEQIRQQRQRTAIQPGNIEQGLTQGASSIGHGFVSGVTGLVNKPKEAYNVKKGKRDLIKGIGKGIVGLFTDPISGVLDAGKNVLIGIQNSADNLLNDQSNVFIQRRKRIPRYINARGVLEIYDERKALGNLCLNLIGKMELNEDYVTHIMIDTDTQQSQNNQDQKVGKKLMNKNNDILLLTTHRVILIKYQLGKGSSSSFNIGIEPRWNIQLIKINQVNFIEKSAQTESNEQVEKIEIKYIRKDPEVEIVRSSDHDSLFAIYCSIGVMLNLWQQLQKQN